MPCFRRVSLSRRLCGSLALRGATDDPRTSEPIHCYDWSKPLTSYHGCATVSRGRLGTAKGGFRCHEPPLARSRKTAICAAARLLLPAIRCRNKSYVLLRLPVMRRRMPLRKRGAFTHTMRTFMMFTSCLRESAEIRRLPADSLPARPRPSQGCTETAAAVPARSARRR